MSDRPGAADPDRGSVLPLVLGLALMLLLLVVGVTAVGSAFLARQDIQHACDGAAAVAGDAVASGQSALAATATRAAQEYLDRPQRRSLAIRVQVTVADDAPLLRCTGRGEVSFAGLFSLQDMEFEVEAAGDPSVRNR